MNRIFLIGNTGKDPECRTFENGTKVANFSLATTKHFTKNGTKESVTTWHNIVCFLKLADIAESYIHKGDKVCIEGELQIREWTDKDGNKRLNYEVVANNIELLGAKKDGEAQPPASDSYQRTGKHDRPPAPIEEQPDGGDDLPFAVTILLAVGTLAQFIC